MRCEDVCLPLRTLIWHYTQRGGQRAILTALVLRGERFHGTALFKACTGVRGRCGQRRPGKRHIARAKISQAPPRFSVHGVR